MVKIESIKIAIEKDKTIEISMEQARELFDALSELFMEEEEEEEYFRPINPSPYQPYYPWYTSEQWKESPSQPSWTTQCESHPGGTHQYQEPIF